MQLLGLALLGSALLVTVQAAPSRLNIEISVDTEYSTHTLDDISIAETITNGNEICLRVCFPESAKCPDGWYLKQFGQCWSCCKTFDLTESSAEKIQAPLSKHVAQEEDTSIAETITNGNEICLRVCFPEDAKCPDGWYLKQFGQCWSCCKIFDLTESSAEKIQAPLSKHIAQAEDISVAETITNVGELCLKICSWAPIPDCPKGWYSKQLGQCWTCCRSYDDSMSSAEKIQAPLSKHIAQEEDISVPEIITKNNQVCWKACFPMKPTCPNGWYASQFGQCWTCCLADSPAPTKKLATPKKGSPIFKLNQEI